MKFKRYDHDHDDDDDHKSFKSDDAHSVLHTTISYCLILMLSSSSCISVQCHIHFIAKKAISTPVIFMS